MKSTQIIALSGTLNAGESDIAMAAYFYVTRPIRILSINSSAIAVDQITGQFVPVSPVGRVQFVDVAGAFANRQGSALLSMGTTSPYRGNAFPFNVECNVNLELDRLLSGQAIAATINAGTFAPAVNNANLFGSIIITYEEVE